MATVAGMRPGSAPPINVDRSTQRGRDAENYWRQVVAERAGTGRGVYTNGQGRFRFGRRGGSGGFSTSRGVVGGGGRYGRGYGGGYGGGGGVSQADFNAYAAAIQQLLDARGDVKPPAWAAGIDTAVDKDVAAANAAYAGVSRLEANPYEDAVFEASEVPSDDLAGVVEAQGGDARQLNADRAQLQADADQGAVEWQNFAEAMQAVAAQANQSGNQMVDASRADAVSGLEAQRHALQIAAQVDQERQRRERENAAVDAILSLFSMGFQGGHKVDFGKFEDLFKG